jgi:hypothetical protein
MSQSPTVLKLLLSRKRLESTLTARTIGKSRPEFTAKAGFR